MRRLFATGLLMTVLTACASTTGSSIAPTPGSFITTPTPSPGVATPTPSSTPPVAMVLSRTFPLVGVGGSHASGRVQVTEREGAFVADVSVRGLASGAATLHTVHIHAGSCANPYGGVHLTVLGLLRVNTTGAGMLTAPLAPVYVANGHYVIVYANTSPQVILGCANLMALS